MINKKYQHFVFVFFMALFMSCIMSFFISLFNVGLVENVLYIWLKDWCFAFFVAFPVVLLISPMVRKLVDILIKNE